MFCTALSRLPLPLIGMLCSLATQALAHQTAPQPAENEPDILITDFEFERFPRIGRSRAVRLELAR